MIQNQEKGTPKKNLTRRDFLKLATVGLGGWFGRKPIEFVSKIISPDLSREIATPDSLADVDIPRFNEHLMRPEDLLQRAFLRHQSWQTEMSEIPNLKYSQPDNYMSLLSLPQTALDSEVDFDDNPGLSMWSLEEAVMGADVPYNKFIEFALTDIFDAKSLITIDPGSGLVQKIKSEFESKFGTENDPYYLARGSWAEKHDSTVKQVTSEWMQSALSWANEVRGEKRLDVSEMIAYFLFKNKGKIMESLWDSTIFFKLIARNNLETLEYSPSQENAEMIGEMFNDPFSMEIPYHWLVDNVDLNDPQLVVEEHEAHSAYKNKFNDFVRINRSGGYYHGLNTIALTGCVDPSIVSLMMRGYFAEGVFHGVDMVEDIGLVRTKADISTADSAWSVKQQLEIFEA